MIPKLEPGTPSDEQPDVAVPAKILVVDDTPANARMLDAVLTAQGYRVAVAGDGEEALVRVDEERPDLILLDIMMPVMDGYETCRRLREDPRNQVLPVIMMTSSIDQEKVKALEVGADDFVLKPFNRAELLARVRSLIRIKQYNDTIEAQTAELAAWNRTLEQRVREQVDEIERVSRLRRFLSPQLADVVISSGTEKLLESHRREVTVVFCDLRGFTNFSATVEPEEVMEVLGEYHQTLGELIFEFGGTLERFAGDGLMVFFNDPLPCDHPAIVAVRMAVEMRRRVEGLAKKWSKRGHVLGFGVGIAQGYATLGRVGFEGRFDYAAIGPVTNLAARLCDEAEAGQILVSQRVHADVEDVVETQELPAFDLKGFTQPQRAFNVLELKTRK